MHTITRSALSAAVLLSLVGCAGDEIEKGDVYGVVTLDGEPLKGVIVQFQPDGLPPAAAITDEEGKYELSFVGNEGAPVGKHEVSVKEVADDAIPEIAEQIGGEPSKVPAKFRTAFKTVDVTSGNNEVNLELTSDGGGGASE